MNIRNIGKEECRALYSHMKRDFPANEIPPFFAVKQNFKKSIYAGFYLTGDIDMGYAVITAPENLNCALLNYFAVFPEYRSKGYGSEFLKILLSRYSDRVFWLEADDPSAAKTGALREQAERRVRFYERVGFRVMPTARAKIFGVDMVIMASRQDKNLNAKDAMRALYMPALGTYWLRFIDIANL